MRKSTFIVLFSLFGVALLGCILAKTVFGESLAIAVSSPNIIAFGEWLDINIWVGRLLRFILTFITYNLYLCACKGKYFLNWKELLIITPILIAMQFVKIYESTIGMSLDMIAMVSLPFFLKCEYKQVVIIYIIHCLAQVMCLYARSLPINLVSVNSAIALIFMLDQYIVYIMNYIFGNFLKRRNKNGRMESTVSNKVDDLAKERTTKSK